MMEGNEQPTRLTLPYSSNPKSPVKPWKSGFSTPQLEQAKPDGEVWKASHTAQNQSNYGRYKTGVHRGEGMNFQLVNIIADTPDLAMEIAKLVEKASAALAAGNPVKE